MRSLERRALLLVISNLSHDSSDCCFVLTTIEAERPKPCINATYPLRVRLSQIEMTASYPGSFRNDPTSPSL
jgi:hypothetical protein